MLGRGERVEDQDHSELPSGVYVRVQKDVQIRVRQGEMKGMYVINRYLLV